MYYYSTHNNKWDSYVVRASLNLSARVAYSPIYFCEKYKYSHNSNTRRTRATTFVSGVSSFYARNILIL